MATISGELCFFGGGVFFAGYDVANDDRRPIVDPNNLHDATLEYKDRSRAELGDIHPAEPIIAVCLCVGADAILTQAAGIP